MPKKTEEKNNKGVRKATKTSATKKTEKVVKESAYRPSNQYTFNEEYLRNWV